MLHLLIRASLVAIVIVQTSVVMSGPLLAEDTYTKVTFAEPTTPAEYSPFYEFTLTYKDKKKKFKIEAISKGTSAEDKAKKIAEYVNAHGDGDFIAVRDGAEVSFKYNPPGISSKLVPAEISGITDTTREADKLAVSAPFGAVYDFGLDGGFASGSTFTGEASILSLMTTGGAATVALTPGLSASEIVDMFFADLTGDGVSLTRLSPTAFEILHSDELSFLSYEMTDTSLFVSGAGARAVPEPGTATLLILSIFLLGLSKVGLRSRSQRSLVKSHHH